MPTASQLDEALERLTGQYESAFIEYPTQNTNFRHAVQKVQKRYLPEKHYGVYIVRQVDDGTVLYIGVSALRRPNQKQDIFTRLMNVKWKNGSWINAELWFRQLLTENGPLQIECLLLNSSLSPLTVERDLLNAHVAAFGRLPYMNFV